MEEQIKPFISVILPFYNGDRQLLTEAVESVLAQTFSDFELLLINDGSEAAYDAFLSELAGRDARMRLITQPNGGVSSARNRGIREARGEFVTFVDADDRVVPTFLEAAVRAARESGAEFVIGGVSYRKERSDLPEVRPYRTRVLTGDRIAKMKKHMVADMIRIGDDGYFSRGPVARLVKTAIAKQVPFTEGIAIGEDIVWNLELCGAYRSACYVEQIWYLYFGNSGSATRRFDPEMFEKCDRELKRIAELLDMDRDEEYLAFVNHVYEELQRFISCSYRWKEWRQDRARTKSVLDRIHHDDPWKEMTAGRYGRLVKGKRKVRYLLHKMKLFIGFYSRFGGR